MVEADLLLDPAFPGGAANVLEDRRAIRDRPIALPRAKGVPQRVHVGVRADPRVAEQIPRAADAVASLEDRERLARAFRLQVVRGADAGEAGSDDQHVNVFEGHVLPF